MEFVALKGPHGAVAELCEMSPDAYFGLPGAKIRHLDHREWIPASHIGTVWLVTPGRVVVDWHSTGGGGTALSWRDSPSRTRLPDRDRRCPGRRAKRRI